VFDFTLVWKKRWS